MDNSTLLNLIEAEERQSIGASSGLLADQRTKSIQRYYGEPYGNEIEGRSQVCTTETLDAIEGILPSIMAIFTSTDEIVRFEPQSIEDEPVADSVTKTVNYIFSRVNNGFVSLYCFFKDALLQKNGFLKVYWEKYEDVTKESYEGLSELEFLQLAQDPALEIIEAEKIVEAVDPMVGEIAVYNVKFKRTEKYGKVCIDPVPPEEILISRETPNDIKKARFVEHKTKKTLSQLRQMGFDVPDDISGDESGDFDEERVARLSYDDDQTFSDEGYDQGATRQVWVREAYIYADYDEDGIAELRKVTRVGKTILDNEEVDSIPFVTCTPILMPHKLYGLSIADLVMPIQEIKTAVTRNLLDNFYFINNGRYEVLDGMVNLSDLLTNRPGGIVRSKVLGGVKRIDTPALGTPAYQMLEYWDQVQAARIGKRTFAPGPNADVLHSSATGAEIYKNWDMERTELIARVFAETGVKDLFWKILELTCKHQDKPMVIKLQNKWVQVDPREWKNKFNMTVTVGLGTGSTQQKLAGAMAIMQAQSGLMQAGLMGRVVTEKNLYEAASLVREATFPKKGDQFFTDPTGLPPPQPQPDPKILLQAQKMQMSDAQKRDKMAMDYDLAMKKMAQEYGMTREEIIASLVETETKTNAQMRNALANFVAQDTKHEKQMAHERMQHGMDMMYQDRQQQPQQASQPQQPTQIVVDNTEGMALIAESLDKMAQAVAMATAPREESEKTIVVNVDAKQPVKKSVNIRRGKNGDIEGAEIDG